MAHGCLAEFPAEKGPPAVFLIIRGRGASGFSASARGAG
ncbi:hypothetical protein GTPT_0910 [Tatumella ptyseos ATCC 33301]|uniref:Uncharacterized protein n=1 Tax=Tatumella ptyseos ATCC 33301 TaxID=1005995 RepID=A0A085JKH5_9GAMM|nr:hypothetical protein GTPT_0910 [Tatumella ptyseos ATCC 33301]